MFTANRRVVKIEFLLQCYLEAMLNTLSLTQGLCVGLVSRVVLLGSAVDS